MKVGKNISHINVNHQTVMNICSVPKREILLALMGVLAAGSANAEIFGASVWGGGGLVFGIFKSKKSSPLRGTGGPPNFPHSKSCFFVT